MRARGRPEALGSYLRIFDRRQRSQCWGALVFAGDLLQAKSDEVSIDSINDST